MRGEPFQAGNPSFVCKKQIVGKKSFSIEIYWIIFLHCSELSPRGRIFQNRRVFTYPWAEINAEVCEILFLLFLAEQMLPKGVPFRLGCPRTFVGALNCYFARSRVIYFRAQIFELICRRVCSLCIGRFRLRCSAKIWDFPWRLQGRFKRKPSIKREIAMFINS